MDFLHYIDAHRLWSARTFGPGARTEGLCRHIAKELDEIRAKPTDLEEWIDVMILALDGAWRTGASPEDIVRTLTAKSKKNHMREWPNWQMLTENDPIEHIKEKESR